MKIRREFLVYEKNYRLTQKAVNRLYDTTLTPEIRSRRLQQGLENIPPRVGVGWKPMLPIPIEGALTSPISTYINFAWAEINKTSGRVTIVNMLSSCLVPGPTTLKDFESLYKRLFPSFAISVLFSTGSSTLENLHAVYSIYNSINILYDTVKDFVIINCFARKRLDDDKDKGKLIFPIGHLNWIVNLGESGLSIDVNHWKTGGQPLTQ